MSPADNLNSRGAELLDVDFAITVRVEASENSLQLLLLPGHLLGHPGGRALRGRAGIRAGGYERMREGLGIGKRDILLADVSLEKVVLDSPLVDFMSGSGLQCRQHAVMQDSMRSDATAIRNGSRQQHPASDFSVRVKLCVRAGGPSVGDTGPLSATTASQTTPL